MKKFTISIIILLHTFFCYTSFSQKTSIFTKTGFLNEIDSIFSKRKNKNDELMLNRFKSAWDSEKFTEQQKGNFSTLANNLKAKNGKNSPHIKNLLYTLINFSEGENQINYNVWENAISDYLKDEKKSIRDINDLLLFTTDLIKSKILNKNYSVSWKTNTNNISFIYSTKLGVNIGSGDLICLTSRDSILIYNTSGIYYPEDKSWEGKMGKVTWERAGFNKDSVYVLLNNYNLTLSGPEYRIDTVNFYYKQYFDQPVIGNLFDKVQHVRNKENTTFPQFESFDKKNKIKNIFPNMDFEGGFRLNGFKMIGIGDQRYNANLFFYRQNKLFAKLSSKRFNINQEKVVGGNQTIVTFYIGDTDSIYHPGLTFTYVERNKEMTFVREGKGNGNSPFFNSYHKLDLYPEVMRWPVYDSVIYMGTIKGSIEDEMRFESSNYYSEKRFAEIQNLDKESPLFIIRDCAERFYGNTFTLEDLALMMKKSLGQAKQMAMNLSVGGFISYNEAKGIIKVNQRTWDYLDNIAGTKDHDVISFISFTGQGNTNAKLYLSSYNLDIYGIQSLLLSETQNLYIYPDNNTITVQKNRDIIFDGKVKTALIDFSGETFYFDYDDFEIRMDTIDNVKMKVPGKLRNTKGEAILQDISSIIEDLSGVLYIDHPQNKSGFFYLPWFPIFESKETAYIYYDDKSILNGAYSREKVFFQIDSFAIDSLNNLEQEGVIQFPGQFITNIFPPIKAELSLQEDYSLGFELSKTPPEGYPVYGGKGRYFNNLSMSKKGLKGDGVLHYLNSITKSNDITFYTDRLQAKAQQFNIAEKKDSIGFPPVYGKDMDILWLPENDKFTSSSNRDSVSVFNEANFSGKLDLDSNRLLANGKLDFGDFELNSNEFILLNSKFDSDNASFKIKKITSSGRIAEFESRNVQTHFDLVKRIGEFSPNSTTSSNSFQSNLFRSSNGVYIYDMNKKNIQMQNTEFTSTDPNQNQLNFSADSSDFDEINNRIISKGVDSIIVGDSYIYPENGEVIIEDGGKLQKLLNARIVIKGNNFRHEIYNANVIINSKINYTAEGYYDYIDQSKTKQTIHLTDIGTNKNGISYAKGTVKPEDEFKISPAFGFVGNIQINGDKKVITFNGSFNLIHECLGISKNWIKFNGEIDTEDPQIPVKAQNTDINNIRLYNSVFISNSNPEIFPSFLSVRKQTSDIAILSSEGLLTFNNTTQQYSIANPEKLEDMNSTGNILQLNRNNCEVYGEGKINLGVNLGQVKLVQTGNIIHKLTEKTTSLNILLGVDFYFAEKALNIMAEAINKANNVQGAETGSLFFRKGLNELIGAEAANNVLGGGGLNAFKKTPEELKHSIFFNNLKLNWNPLTSSYQAIDNISIGNINGLPVNKKLKGYFELTKKRSGDILSWYIELDKSNWFFFQYSRGLMQGISSDEKFNKEITKVKADKRKQKVDRGQQSYQYYISNQQLVDRFKAKFLK